MINATVKTSPTFTVQFIDPLYVTAQLEIVAGNIIADFGCGAGYFSIPLSRAVGKEGRVYSLDVLPQALEAVESKARVMGIDNIITRRVNLENKKGSSLADGSADWIVIKDMLFQNHRKDAIMKEAYRVLKPGGKALIVEWNNKDFSVGPDKKLRVSREMLWDLIQATGFSVDKEIEAGNFHYAVVVVKKTNKLKN